MEQHFKLLPSTGDPLFDPSTYCLLIGRLFYLSVTKPDISFSVNYLSQFIQHPCTFYMNIAFHVL